MSNVVRLEEKFVVASQVLLGQVGRDIRLTKDLLDKPAFNVNVVTLTQKVIKMYVSPAILKIKEVQKNLEQLRRFNVFAREKANFMVELADDLLIDVVIAKKNLEEIRLRSNAQVLAQAVIKKNLNPALRKIEEIQKVLAFPEMQISQKYSSLKPDLKLV